MKNDRDTIIAKLFKDLTSTIKTIVASCIMFKLAQSVAFCDNHYDNVVKENDGDVIILMK